MYIVGRVFPARDFGMCGMCSYGVIWPSNNPALGFSSSTTAREISAALEFSSESRGYRYMPRYFESINRLVNNVYRLIK